MDYDRTSQNLRTRQKYSKFPVPPFASTYGLKSMDIMDRSERLQYSNEILPSIISGVHKMHSVLFCNPFKLDMLVNNIVLGKKIETSPNNKSVKRSNRYYVVLQKTESQNQLFSIYNWY